MCDVKSTSRSAHIQEAVLAAVMEQPGGMVAGEQIADINDVLGLAVSNRMLHSALWHLVEQNRLRFRRTGGTNDRGDLSGYPVPIRKIYTVFV